MQTKLYTVGLSVRPRKLKNHYWSSHLILRTELEEHQAMGTETLL